MGMDRLDFSRTAAVLARMSLQSIHPPFPIIPPENRGDHGKYRTKGISDRGTAS
jgi:hypothetical protein